MPTVLLAVLLSVCITTFLLTVLFPALNVTGNVTFYFTTSGAMQAKCMTCPVSLDCCVMSVGMGLTAPIAPCRRPLGGGLVELRHGPRAEHSSRWLQVSHTLQPSVPRLDVQLDQTTVSLAFNLEGEAPTQQQVYAFLPLRSYGLCFIVQVSAPIPPPLPPPPRPPQKNCYAVSSAVFWVHDS